MRFHRLMKDPAALPSDLAVAHAMILPNTPRVWKPRRLRLARLA
jgi:hypothetical protein